MDEIDAISVGAKIVKDGMGAAHELSKGAEETQGYASTASSKGDADYHFRDKAG